VTSPALDLAHTTVFLDFDGTISTVDVGRHLLERLGAPAWRDIDEQYERGEIGSRECLIDEWDLIAAEEATLRSVASEVGLDPMFGPLVRDLRAGGAEVTVVSDGFGFYVQDACAPFDVPVLTNTVDFATGRLEFPHEDRCCPCTSCGVCKQAPIKDAHHRGRTTVLVGDGVSDRKAALLADVVFAKDALAWWCSTAGVAFTEFRTLADVHDALVGELAPEAGV
jgi:2,3-diketo-5-methylthio-1-phosphopentane phosphatase